MAYTKTRAKRTRKSAQTTHYTGQFTKYLTPKAQELRPSHEGAIDQMPNALYKLTGQLLAQTSSLAL